MRRKLWDFARRNHTEGTLLTWWLLIVRAILFPVDTIYWQLSTSRGYQWESDTWLVEGIRISGCAARTLAKSNGQTLRVRLDGDLITIEAASE